jgi:hypothetical protein
MADLDAFEDAPVGGWALAALGLLTVPAVRRQLTPLVHGVRAIGAGIVALARQVVGEPVERDDDLVRQAPAEPTAPGG